MQNIQTKTQAPNQTKAPVKRTIVDRLIGRNKPETPLYLKCLAVHVGNAKLGSALK